MKGTIKKLISHRGYGFIDTDEQEEDLFFHRSQLVSAKFDELREGDVVEFEIEQTEKGPQAIQIKVTEKAEPSADNLFGY